MLRHDRRSLTKIYVWTQPETSGPVASVFVLIVLVRAVDKLCGLFIREPDCCPQLTLTTSLGRHA